jgi:hypothetical protein
MLDNTLDDSELMIKLATVAVLRKCKQPLTVLDIEQAVRFGFSEGIKYSITNIEDIQKELEKRDCE